MHLRDINKNLKLAQKDYELEIQSIKQKHEKLKNSKLEIQLRHQNIDKILEKKNQKEKYLVELNDTYNTLIDKFKLAQKENEAIVLEKS